MDIVTRKAVVKAMTTAFLELPPNYKLSFSGVDQHRPLAPAFKRGLSPP